MSIYDSLNGVNLHVTEQRSVRQQKYAGYSKEHHGSLIEYDPREDCFVVITDMPDGSVHEVKALGIFVAEIWAENAYKVM
ncbi:MAG: hypothetical protein ACXABY_28010 [Candidatus Thorarchaeota archaeon]|jgi:hypothetical protein